MPGRISSPVLVGRDADVESIVEAFEDAAAGRPRFVVVTGEAGLGKTRVVEAATAAARDQGFMVLIGACLDIGPAGLPYLPLAEALRGLARTVEPDALSALLGTARESLALLVPELATADHAAAVEASDEEGALPSALRQARLFERVLGLFGGLGASAPTILVVEDVHWIDRATRDLLVFLARNLTDERIAIVLTCRDDDLPRGHPILAWLADVGSAPSAVRVELHRLDRGAVERQLQVISGAQPDAALAERIWRRSQGNPLFVEELLAASSSGRPDDRPGSLVEILLSRVARLPGEARDIVDAAAVAGRPIDDRLLANVLELAEDEVDSRLRVALANGVLVIDPGDGLYRFRHELLREVVERELLPGERRRLHERFARRLEERPELADPSPVGAAAELAHHFAEAGVVDEAYRRSIDAAAAAEAVLAYADAFRHLERAIDLESRLGGDGPTAAERLDLRRRTADAADLAGEIERAMALTFEGLALLDPTSDPATAGVLHSRIGYFQWILGDSVSALDEHKAAVELVPAEPPTAARARVLASLGGALMGAGRWAESRAVCEAAVDCAVRAGAAAEESRARNMLGSDLVGLGQIEAGIEELRKACQIAVRTGPSDVLIIGHYNLALNLILADRLEEALAEAEAGQEAARATGLSRRFGQDLAALLADILIRMGRWDDADVVTSTGLAFDPAAAGTTYLATVRARLVGLRGDRAEAERRLAPIDVTSLDPDVAAFVAAVVAETSLAANQPEPALQAVELGLHQLEGLDDVFWAMPLVALGLRAAAELAEAARARRAERELAATVTRAAPLRERLAWLASRVTTDGGLGWLGAARADVARLDGTTAAGDWSASIEAFDRIGEAYEAAYGRFRAAEAALQIEGVKADVGPGLRAAAATAAALKAQPLTGVIGGLAARARIALEAPPAKGREPDAAQTVTPVASEPHAEAHALGLSAREIEVLELVSAGLSNGEIADRLFITRKTAAVHVTHILDKLGVPNRVGAAMIAARIGLAIDRPEPDRPEPDPVG